MKLSELSVSGLRNLSQVSLKSMASVNILFGKNGAGKTSVLEAIHMLGMARSFRGTQQTPVIQFDRSACLVSGLLDTDTGIVRLGVERTRNRGTRIRVNGKDEKSALPLTQNLPVQLINASSYLLLEGGPKQRRAFLDWGVFHVEHSFYDVWRRAQRSIKQRNSLLREYSRGRAKNGIDQVVTALRPWDQELRLVTVYLDDVRRRYLQDFEPLFYEMLATITELESLELEYYRGWSGDQPFENALADDLSRDLKRGLTHQGPHRADVRVLVNSIPAGQILSRGQQKLVVSAMRLAQSALLFKSTGKRCVMLIDDLPAEIDAEHQERLCRVLDDLGMQVFVTCIDESLVSAFAWSQLGKPKLFHVKQGSVSVVNSEP